MTMAGQAETTIKRDLTAAYRLIAHHQLTDTIFTHITAQSALEKDHVYINRYGLFFDEVTPQSLVLCSLTGAVKQAGSQADGLTDIINPNGFHFHAVIHEHIKDAACVIHLHNHASTVVSAHPDGLLGLSQNAMRFSDQVAWYDYDGVNPSEEQLAEMVRTMGDKPVLAMRHHGMLAIGRSVAEAFHRAYYFNKACQEQIDILSATDKPIEPRGPAVERAKAFFSDPQRISGEREWPAWLRFLDRTYRGWDRD
jgi:ribulose-5-phosphate 4-epimerase/fuculose-1-phosphate aldolase